MSEDIVALGLETSCDETAAAVVRLRDGRAAVLSSIVSSQIADHQPYGGVVPEIAARGHAEVIDLLMVQALQTAGVGIGDLNLVAATAGPGLVGGVMVGLSAAKGLALAAGLPLIAVNHLEGHALSPRLTHAAPYPFLLLLVSGGHCQLLSVEALSRYTRLGSTIDDAAGEAFDKIAAVLGLPYPGGPALEVFAAGGRTGRFTLPRALLDRKDCDFSFSGLKTAAARLAADLVSEADRRDLAACVQDAICDQLVSRSERAMARHLERSSGAGRLFVVAGGVAANRTVRARLEALCGRHGFEFLAPDLAYCTDNAAMIALAGAERFAAGLIDDLDAPARPRWPLDEHSARLNPIHAPGRKGAKA